MRSSQVTLAIKTCLLADQPVMLHGSPGAGKSQVVKQVTKELGMGFIDVRLSQLDPVDLRGVPSIDQAAQMTTWNPPDFLPRTEAMGGKHPDTGVLFLDEINSAAQGTAAAAYQLVLDRRLGDYELPEGWRIVAAGNRSTDRALVNEMSTALKNRFSHLDYEVNNDDWTQWAFGNEIHESVIGFLRFQPMLLNEFEERNQTAEEKNRVKKLKNAKAFGTPRSWEFVSNIMKTNPPKEIEFELIAGTVGEGAAASFFAYLKFYRDMPSIDEILLNPKKAPIPAKNQPATTWAVCTALAMRSDKDNLSTVLEYTSRLEREYQVLVVKDSLSRDRSLGNTTALHKWAAENSGVLI